MTIRNIAFAAAISLAGLGVLAAPALAQRDPAYQAARDSGQIGEKMDGYLGIVGAETPALRAMVDDLNNRRRAAYAQEAQAQGVTLIEMALTGGCRAIRRTVPGEMYEAPNGSWQRRGTGEPQLDPRCP